MTDARYIQHNRLSVCPCFTNTLAHFSDARTFQHVLCFFLQPELLEVKRASFNIDASRISLRDDNRTQSLWQYFQQSSRQEWIHRHTRHHAQARQTKDPEIVLRTIRVSLDAFRQHDVLRAPQQTRAALGVQRQSLSMSKAAVTRLSMAPTGLMRRRSY
jgi:hypothetical protein